MSCRSNSEASSAMLANYYARRWTIGAQFSCMIRELQRDRHHLDVVAICDL